MILQPITFLLVLLVSCVQSCWLHRRYHDDAPNSLREIYNSSITAQPGHELLRRWYGVKSLPPADSDQSYLSPYYYPWPVTCSGPKIVQPIRYCFGDERSATNLQSIIDSSVAAWTQAMLVSSFTVILEPTCQGNIMCLCTDPGVATDALMISDETKDNDDDWNQGPDCYTASTVGYRYIPKVKFCSLAPQYSWGQVDDATRDMIHEIGHVLGLQHEHQRPDRNEFIWFKCKNLKGYDEAYHRANIDEEGWFDDDENGEELSMKEKMSRICNHELYAMKFFPTALEYIRGDVEHMDNIDSQAFTNNLVKSDEFDYDSIMIYDGDLMSRNKQGKRYVLFRRETNGGAGPPVWMGGGVNGELKSTKLSEGDVARVARLYASGAPLQDVSWGPVQVKIRDRLEIVVPAPRKRDEL